MSHVKISEGPCESIPQLLLTLPKHKHHVLIVHAYRYDWIAAQLVDPCALGDLLYQIALPFLTAFFVVVPRSTPGYGQREAHIGVLGKS
jgi:hypothetical protein